jgi:anti-sigma B factor antagonist
MAVAEVVSTVFPGALAMTIKVDMNEDLDAAAMETLRARFEELSRSREDIELNLASVRFIDSSGVGGIVFLYKRLAAAGLQLWLTGVNNQPRQVLEYVGLLPLMARRFERAVP